MKGTRNNEEEISSNFRDTGQQNPNGRPVSHPPSTIHHHQEYKKILGIPKGRLTSRFLKQKLSLEQDKRQKEIKLGPLNGPLKGWSTPPGDKIL